MLDICSRQTAPEGILHIGVIGAGRIGALHAHNLRQLPTVDEVSISDSDEARVRGLADSIDVGIAQTVPELLERVDGVVVATPTAAHARLTLAAVEAGVPVLCEKPISLDLATTDQVLATVARAGVALQVGFQRRFDPAFVEARRRVAAGDLGRVYLARMAAHDAEPPPESYLPASGGIFLDLHIHDFDAVRWLTGQDIVEVYADGAVVNEMFGRHDDVDVTSIVMRLSDGALAISTGSRHDPVGYDHRTEILGSRDCLSMGYDSTLALRPADAPPDQPSQTYRTFIERFAAAYREEVAQFVELVGGRAANQCTGYDAREALVAALAATVSRRERRPVQTAEIAAGSVVGA
jgi:myo-inositol 2-dehydrogenase/D-chiro-inositol 1-dehydrogenase